MWELMCIIGVLFLILEIFTPALFFLNLAFAAFATAGLTVFVSETNVVIFTFVVFSALFLLILRPILMNLKTTKEQKTGMEGKYIGQVVKVISPITKTSGAITIYGERWEARTDGDSEIAEGANVKIVRNESLIMFVEEVKD
ncbi:MAG: NfeD family protein [Cyanobacteria bacterium RUI128]|nr:NfeD family protein [Cyanobacteria bacterium RUI128]